MNLLMPIGKDLEQLAIYPLFLISTQRKDCQGNVSFRGKLQES